MTHFYCGVNISLTTSEVATGATEIWLGGQNRENVENQADGDLSVGGDLVEERRLIQPSTQPMGPKGSMVLRDLRLWHAGSPNPSDKWRCMIALGFTAPWWHTGNRFRIPAESEIASRIDEGLKGNGVVPMYREVSQQDYAGS